MTEVLLISRSHEYELRLQGLLGANLTSVMGAFLTFGTEVVFNHIADTQPDVVFVGPYLSFETANDLSTGLRERYPGVAIVLVHENKAAIDGWLDDLGANEVISPAATDDEVLGLVARLGAPATAEFDNEPHPDIEPENASDLDSLSASDESPDSDQSDVVDIRDIAADEGPRQVIAVISPKGGLGKTTIATNLAVGLARLARDSVVLVDADVQFGDVATVLGLEPTHTLPDMVSGLAARDSMVLKTFLMPHPAGFYVVGGAESPADGDRVTGEQLSHLIRQLSDIFRYVIIDTTPGLGEHALSAIEQATDAIVLCSMGVPNLRALRKELTVLTSIGLMPPSRHIVLNLADKTSGLNRRDAEETIGAPVDIMIPRSKAVPLSTNRGVPILQESPRDPAAKALLELVARLRGVPAARSAMAIRTKGVA
jgi:MinD-like ATPase involved in chromosome partitioning or flagellar assembly